MGEKTAIEWTDATWNPVTGCTKISAGCKFCYAERITERQGQDFSKIVLHPNRLDQPLRWRKPRLIFVNSMSDLFHEKAERDWIAAIFGVMARCVHHMFQILTKRPERMRAWIKDSTLADSLAAMALASPATLSHPLTAVEASALAKRGWPPPHVWLGVSVETQATADERIPLLLQTPAAVRFLSVEPLLEKVDIGRYLHWSSLPFLHPDPYRSIVSPPIDWVIVGGESGGPLERRLIHRHPFGNTLTLLHPREEALDWVRSLRDHCVAAGVPFFFKQWGGPTPKSGGRLLDGRTWDEMPQRGMEG